MSGRAELQSKRVGETRIITFNFSSDLASGETISTKAVTAAVYSGTDAAPANVVSGAASSSGAIVSQVVTGGVAGVIYIMTCTITTSLSQILVQNGYLAVLPEAA